MKKTKLQSKLQLSKETIASLSVANQAELRGGSGLTPCLENGTDTNFPMSEMNCYSYFYKCGWRTWINCGQNAARMQAQGLNE